MEMSGNAGVKAKFSFFAVSYPQANRGKSRAGAHELELTERYLAGSNTRFSSCPSVVDSK
jgi:hypothetical protein